MAAYEAKTPNNYVSPLGAGTKFHIASCPTIYPYDGSAVGMDGETYYPSYSIRVYDQSNQTLFSQTRVSKENSTGTIIELKSGSIGILYQFHYRTQQGIPGEVPSWIVVEKTVSATYTFQVVQNQYPPKKFTVKDTVDRVLTLVEPLVVERDTALPGYISIVQGLIKNIDNPGGVDKLFSCLDTFYKQGGQAKRCAITFYTNMQKSLMNLVGDTKFADLKKSLDTDNFDLEKALGDALNGLSIDDMGNLFVIKPVRPR